MKRKKIAVPRTVLLLVAVLVFVLICFIVGRIPSQPVSEETESAVSTTSQTASEESADSVPWNLILVNSSTPLPEDFTPSLATLKDYRAEQVDSRILEDLTQMLTQMSEQGLSPLVCSSYRDYTRQMALFNQQRDEYVEQGMDNEEAYAAAMKSMAQPGYSEHETGLALDIVSVEHQTLDTAFASTPEGQWLAAHAAEYGFVVRYAEDKQDITGITYEPWHVRYVGKEAAQEMVSLNLCLEEYLAYKGYA